MNTQAQVVGTQKSLRHHGVTHGSDDDARAFGHSIVPSCSGAARFVQRHLEHPDLLASSERG